MPKVYLSVDKDGWTGQIQLSISKTEGETFRSGYRLAGPKYNGSSKNLLTKELTEVDKQRILECLGVE